MEKTIPITVTTLNQLGGKKFLFMIGASRVLALNENTIEVKFTASRAANYLTVEYLPANDLYTMTLGKIHGSSYKVKEVFTEIGSENLAPLFEKTTSIRTCFESPVFKITHKNK